MRLNTIKPAEGSKHAHHVVSALAQNARVILAGEITRKVTVRGLGVTKGARAAIEAAGGSIADNE